MIKESWIQTALSVVLVVGAIGGVYSTTQARLAVLDQQVAALIVPNHKIVTEQEWATDHASILVLKEKVSAAESRHEQVVAILNENQRDFTQSIRNLNEVLQDLAVAMAGVDARLGGFEGQLDSIRKKI